jgi:hypothetical protein
MTIRAVSELKKEKIEIDLTGPEGNAFVLLGTAKSLAKQLHMDPDPIIADMMSADYDNLIEVFDSNFGDYVDLYR